MSLPTIAVTAAGKTALEAALAQEGPMEYDLALRVVTSPRDPSGVVYGVCKDEPGHAGRITSRGIAFLREPDTEAIAAQQIGASGGRPDFRRA